MNSLTNKIKNLKSWLIDVRRDLHKTPELGLEEFLTKEKIIKYLEEIGIDYTTYPNHTGGMAYINKNAKNTVAIRADIDALPIVETNNKSYKSIHSGKMHACGHDAHTAILLGSCKVLYDMRDELDVNVKFLFQPAEETVGGAKLLIKDGCMENPKVDYTIGLHVMPHINTGMVELQYGSMNASTDTVSITIEGKQCHGAYPHQGVDAIVAAGHVICALQSIVSRNIDPVDSVVLSLGVINGGIKENVICPKVTLGGTLRTLNPDTRRYTKERIKEIVDFTCKGLDAKGSVDIEEGYAPLVNDNFVVDIVKENAINLLGKDNVVFRKHPSLGAEDFSFFLEHSKGAFYHLGCRNEEKNILSPLHTADFDIDEDCLEIGVMLHVLNTLSFAKL